MQYAERDLPRAAAADEERLTVGVNLRLRDHDRVLRLSYGQIAKDGHATRDLVQLTMQLFRF